MDITKHLKDVHLRVPVVVALLHELIDRGFPGYVPTIEECERMGKTQAQMIRWRKKDVEARTAEHRCHRGRRKGVDAQTEPQR